jgi:hypothetical protein
MNETLWLIAIGMGAWTLGNAAVMLADAIQEWWDER